ncbi:MAG: nicotinamide riboside transporter PnuC [Bacteroidetes bacterium]|nr:nicotinamide riboside transporter PnuC [Bacteroidota bacterium]
MLHSIFQQFIAGIQQTTLLEFIAVVAGITSVWFSRKENILVYPIGLINTIIYTWLCFKTWQLYAEGSLNFYYTAMSIYGWYCWSNKKNNTPLSITFNTKKDWIYSLSFFVFSWIILFFVLKKYTNSNVPLADSFASASAYTAMWQMAKKKIENWLWWIITNIASIPLYFYKHAVFTSFQYVVFLILAIAGYIEWKRKITKTNS